MDNKNRRYHILCLDDEIGISALRPKAKARLDDFAKQKKAALFVALYAQACGFVDGETLRVLSGFVRDFAKMPEERTEEDEREPASVN